MADGMGRVYYLVLAAAVAVLGEVVYSVSISRDKPGYVEYGKILIHTTITFGLVYLYKKSLDVSSSPEKSDGCSAAISLPSKLSTLHLIKSRRSIMPKDLNGEKISEENIRLLLEAGNWAPTHHRTEPWRYVVISGPENIVEYLDFHDTWYSSHREDIPDADYAQFLKKYEGMKTTLPSNASHLFVICMKRKALPDKLLPEWEEIAATASSVQNIHLTLASMPGCGGFWSSHTWCKHSRDSPQFKEYLGLEPEDRVFGAFILGRVSPGRTFRSARRDWQDKVTWRTE